MPPCVCILVSVHLSAPKSRFSAAVAAMFTAPQNSEESQKPQPPLLLKKVSQYTSHLYCNTPPICTAVLLVPLGSEEREYCQYSSHLYRSTPPICIAVRLPFVSQYFWGKILVVVVTGMFPKTGCSWGHMVLKWTASWQGPPVRDCSSLAI